MTALCIYHGTCADGFAAACCVEIAHPGEYKFYAATHGDPPPLLEGIDTVLCVDFCYPLDVLFDIASRVRRVVVIDHHVSAMRQFENLVLPGNLTLVFDMNQSGAGLTWSTLLPNQPRPRLIDHIEDRDLWRFKLEGTREISAALFSYEYDMTTWVALIKSGASSGLIDLLLSEGAAIQRKHMKDVRELIAKAGFRTEIAGWSVPCLNIPYTHGSEACNIMCKDESFAAYYWNCGQYQNFGLRSEDGRGLDVSEIARSYGGGGHRHSAGFRLPIGSTRISLRGQR